MVPGAVDGWRPSAALNGGGGPGGGAGRGCAHLRSGATAHHPLSPPRSCRGGDRARHPSRRRAPLWAAAVAAAAAAAALVSSVTAVGSAGEVVASAVSGAGSPVTTRAAVPSVLRWATEPLRRPPRPPRPRLATRPVTRHGVAAPAGDPSGEAAAGGAGTALSAGGVPGGTPSPSPAPTVIPYSLESVHKPHFLASTNRSSCTASSVTSVAHLPVPNRPGVFLIPHSLVRMDGAVCSATRAPSPPYTDAQVRELLAGPGTLVTRRRNVATEAAAIAAGTEDFWALLSPLKNAVSILNHFTYVDLWVGVERDDPRVCRWPRMAAGSVFFWFRALPNESFAIPSIGLDLPPDAAALFGVNADGERICVWSRTAADTYVPTPPPVLAAAAEPNLGFRSCFPAAARVSRADGSTAAMADVAIGDALRVGAAATAGAAAFSRVYLFAHRLGGGTYDFLELTTADAARPSLTLSAGHLVYLADGRRVAAARVVPGDRLQPAESLATPTVSAAGAAVGAGTNRTATAAAGGLVTRVTRVRRAGLYNPMTLHGDLIVDGYRVSTYTADVPPVVAAALLAPARALYLVTGRSTGVLEGGVPPLPPAAAVAAAAVTAAVAAAVAAAAAAAAAPRGA